MSLFTRLVIPFKHSKQIAKCTGKMIVSISLMALITSASRANEFSIPQILTNSKVEEKFFLPDFSYAGYHHGELNPDTSNHKIINVSEYGITANEYISKMATQMPKQLC